MSYYEGGQQEQQQDLAYEGSVGDNDYSNYDYGGEYTQSYDEGAYSEQSGWAQDGYGGGGGEGGEYYATENGGDGASYGEGGEYYDENGGYYDENGNYVYAYDAAAEGADGYDAGGGQQDDLQSASSGADDYAAAAAPSPPSTSLTVRTTQDLPRSTSSLMLAQLASEFAHLDSPSSSLYLAPPAPSAAKVKPPPPRLRNGEIPPYYDDEETGYQYYLVRVDTALRACSLSLSLCVYVCVLCVCVCVCDRFLVSKIVQARFLSLSFSPRLTLAAPSLFALCGRFHGPTRTTMATHSGI
jgi:hypothetical protein